MKNKKVLVVGGAGFIGSHLTEALLKEGASVFVVDNLFLGKKENIPLGRVVFRKIDASNIDELFGVVSLYGFFDVVYNLAVMPLPHSLDYPFKNIDVNLRIVNNLCLLLKQENYGKLVHFSSSEVYGSALYTPMCENHPLEASTPYAASKAAGDLICLSYYRTFGCPISIIRPFNNYGERQNAGTYAGVIPFSLTRLKDEKHLIITGHGKQTRDFIYAGDTARAAILLGERDDLNGEVFNIASGQDVSILTLLHDIVAEWCIQTGNRDKHTIEMQPARPGDVDRHIANVLKAKDVLGFEPAVRIEVGLKKTIEWFLKTT